MDQAGDGAGRPAEPFGDLGQRPAVPVLQHQRFAGVRRQLLQSLGQLQRRFLALGRMLGDDCSAARNASSRAEEASSVRSR